MMISSILNIVLALGLSLALLHYCDVPVESAMLVGVMLGIFYTLMDISSHLHKLSSK